jgi:hypothetical protein
MLLQNTNNQTNHVVLSSPSATSTSSDISPAAIFFVMSSARGSTYPSPISTSGFSWWLSMKRRRYCNTRCTSLREIWGRKVHGEVRFHVCSFCKKVRKKSPRIRRCLEGSRSTDSHLTEREERRPKKSRLLSYTCPMGAPSTTACSWRARFVRDHGEDSVRTKSFTRHARRLH